MHQATTLSKPKDAVITISDRAAERIKELLSKREKQSLAIRVSVKAGGCSGMTYIIEYADHKQPFDEEVEDKGVKVLVDPKAVMYILNAEMDFFQDKFKSGFTFKNPHEKGRCGCGESFYV